METGINVPTIVYYVRHDGTATLDSYLPEVPRGMHLQEVCKMLSTLVDAAETQKRTKSDPKDKRREFVWTWLGSGIWIKKMDIAVPASAAKHLLIGIQKELVEQNDLHYFDTLASVAGENYGFKDHRRGEPDRRVFIIHGRDQKSLTQLAAFLEHRGFTPQSLSRLPTRGGETLIEALERLLPEAEFLVALFTPDDEGRLRGGDEPLKPRVRQNVLIEAGFAVIQRRHESIIVVLGDTDIPSDLAGIRRIEADKWNFSVEEELEQALASLESTGDNPA